MKQKTQLIVLGVLVVVLIVTAAIVLRPQGGKKRKVANVSPLAKTASVAPVFSKNAVPPGAEKTPTAVDPGSIPGRAELALCAAWFAVGGGNSSVPDSPAGEVLGLAGGAEATVCEKTTADSARGEESEAAPAVELPKLDGIFWRAGGGCAVIEGEAYRVGQKVANTGFTVVAVRPNVVELRAGSGPTVTLNLVR